MANCAARIRTALDARRAPFQQGPVRDHAPALSRLVFGVVSLASRGAIRRDSAEAALAHKSHLLAGKHCCGIERDCTSLARPSAPEPSGAAQPSGARQLRETQRLRETRRADCSPVALPGRQMRPRGRRRGQARKHGGARAQRQGMDGEAQRREGRDGRERGIHHTAMPCDAGRSAACGLRALHSRSTLPLP